MKKCVYVAPVIGITKIGCYGVILAGSGVEEESKSYYAADFNDIEVVNESSENEAEDGWVTPTTNQ